MTFPAKETILFTVSGCGDDPETVKYSAFDSGELMTKTFFLNGHRKSVNMVSLMRTSNYS